MWSAPLGLGWWSRRRHSHRFGVRDDTATSGRVAVVGAHLSGMPLKGQLTSRHAVRVAQSQTAPCYRLCAGQYPAAEAWSGLVRNDRGQCIDIKLRDRPLARCGECVAEIPAPLGIGTLQWRDGEWVKGFICEPCALAGARDITAYGGWCRYSEERERSRRPAT